MSTDEAIAAFHEALAVVLPRVEATDGKAGLARFWLEACCLSAAAVAEDEGREGLDRVLRNMYEYRGQHLPRA